MNTRKSLYDIESFYDKKAILKSSFQGMRYQVQRYCENEEAEPVLRGIVWPEPCCFVKTPDEKKTVFYVRYTEEGLDELYEWLCRQYESREEEWVQARDNPYQGLF